MTSRFDPLICHERFLLVESAIDDVLARARQGDPQILPIVGPSRVGKSTLLRNLAGQPPAGQLDREVLMVQSPQFLSRRALPDACLSSLGLMPDMYRNQVLAEKALILGLKRAGTRLIIFDETQHMLERGGRTSMRAAGDFLKSLFDEAGCSLLLVGLPSLLAIFEMNEQLAGRSRRAIEYYPYQWDGTDFREFRRALAGALQALTDAGWQTFPAADLEFARRMYLATAGRYGVVHRVFQEVEALGSTRQQPKTAGYPEFARAFDVAVMTRVVDFNPFDESHPVQVEHMALAYASVMEVVGVARGGRHRATAVCA